MMMTAGTRGRTGQRIAATPVARPPGRSELRLRIGGVEIAVTGTSRQDCLQQLEAALREVEAEGAPGAPASDRWRLTPAGERALELGGVA